MTIKKSLISVSAAALLVAGMTGCSSSDSDPVVSTTPTSITATDGYVLNYTATASIADGNESNITYATVQLPNAVQHASIAAGATQVAGSATLDLTKDLTAAQIANLRGVNLVHKAQSTDGTTLTYGTFFDVNSDNKFVAADGDIIAPTTFAMSTPAGYANITPITTLIDARITTLTSGETNESNRTAFEALALTQIATALGLSESDIKSVDPISVVESNPKYTLINSMLGQAITDSDMTPIATSLATATAATDAVSALRNIAAGATASKAYFTSAADQIAADSSFLANVKTMNLDATRNTAAAQTTFTPVTLKAGTADFNVTKITLGASNVDASALLSSGAKVDFSDLDLTKLTLVTAADKNISNKPVTLAVSIAAQETHVLGDANITSLTFLVPMELNSTEGTENARVSGDVKWEGVKATGAVFSGEMNATTFNSKVASPVGVATGVMTLKVGTMISVIDTNSSNAAGIVDNNISDIKIALVDSNSSLQRVSGTKGQYWGNTQVSAVGGTINVSGKDIFKNTLTDGRVAGGVANKAPANTLTLKETTDGNLTGSGTTAAPYVVTNNTSFGLILGVDVGDTNEKNTTVSFATTGNGAASFDLNTTDLIKMFKSDSSVANTAMGSEINTTTTAATIAGDVNMTLTTTITDEFGEANSTKYYFMIDRPAYVNSAAGYAFPTTATDKNASKFLLDYDTNTTLSTITAGAVVILENNNSNAATDFVMLNLSTPSVELNLSDTSTELYKITLQSDGTLELNNTAPTDVNLTVIEIHVTDAHGADFNVTSNDTNYSF